MHEMQKEMHESANPSHREIPERPTENDRDHGRMLRLSSASVARGKLSDFYSEGEALLASWVRKPPSEQTDPDDSIAFRLSTDIAQIVCPGALVPPNQPTRGKE